MNMDAAFGLDSSILENVCISLIHAFEYNRACSIENDIHRIEQNLNKLNDYNFINLFNIENNEGMVIIHPDHPKNKDIKAFFNNNKKVIQQNWEVNFDELIQVLNNRIIPSYKTYFSSDMRRTGSILIKLSDIHENIIGALHIFNIKSDHKKYLIFNKPESTFGFFRKGLNNSHNAVFLATSVEDALTISEIIPTGDIFATTNLDHLADSILKINQNRPDALILVFIKNCFTPYTLDHADINQIKESELFLLNDLFTSNPNILNNIGIIMPNFSILTKIELESFSDIRIEYGLNDAKSSLMTELEGLFQRRESKSNEFSYLRELYSSNSEKLKNKHGVQLIDLEGKSVHRKNNNVLNDRATNNPILREDAIKDIFDYFNK